MSRRSNTIEAHALGVALTDDDMSVLLSLEKERLIERHKSHVARLHAGIRQRALDHQAEVSKLEKWVVELQRERETQSRKINWIFLALAFSVGLAMYFMVRDASCPALPWIVKITQ